MVKESSWKFYSVRMVKQIIVKNGKEETNEELQSQHFEELILLIRAQSGKHAIKIAEEKAKKDEEPYLNANDQIVEWKFIKVIDCFEIISVLKSGTEIYSCLHTTDKEVTAESFINQWFKETNS